ncbi:SIR2 family protein [Myxococcus sp. CA033]|uniref:SIR2 family protein n=1 Tax=Myxococcus sp. CA033 TaxID=2741516 RepID=UPI00157A2328|nr:SIR2 family protein [Myxococcus sp. CA033]NTX38901.1 SIR2 family protein [Myxococcus sp. CA033]
MSAESTERLESLDALVHALSMGRKKIALLVGSALSMADKPGAPGVPGTTEMLKVAQRAVGTELQAKFEAAIAQDDGTQKYQHAMRFLLKWHDQQTVNQVVREAVLQSRLDPAASGVRPDQELDRDTPGWAPPAATRDLGRLVVAHRDRFGPILTTNFDPLLTIAIRQAGGRVSQTILHADGRLDAVRTESDDHAIVHLHGYWNGADTLHTKAQLTQERNHLKASIHTLLREYTLLVVGYGGWDDIITRALAECGYDTLANVDIVWAFYESKPEEIQHRYKRLFSSISSLYGRGWFREYGGINCHVLFKALHDAMDRRVGVSTRPALPIVASAPPAPSSPTIGDRGAVLPAPPHAPSVPSPAPEATVKRPRKARSVKAAKDATPPPESRPHTAWLLASLALVGVVGTLGHEWVTRAPERSPQGDRPGTGLDPVVRQPARVAPPPRTESPITLAPVPFGPPATLEALRTQNRVRLLVRSPQGIRTSEMPDRSYAFVSLDQAYLLRSARILEKSSAEAFEIHHLQGDAFCLVGYVQPTTAKALDMGRPVNVVMSPRATADRNQVVSIPFKRIVTIESRTDDGRRVLLLNLEESGRQAIWGP